MAAEARHLETSVPILADIDIVTARQQGRALAERVGFIGSDLTVIATVISELGRNMLTYAERGVIRLRPHYFQGRRGIQVVAEDDGPGIVDVELALQDAYSTSKSLGLGLPGTRRLMDEFEIFSVLGKGTKVTVTKWVS